MPDPRHRRATGRRQGRPAWPRISISGGPPGLFPPLRLRAAAARAAPAAMCSLPYITRVAVGGMKLHVIRYILFDPARDKTALKTDHGCWFRAAASVCFDHPEQHHARYLVARRADFWRQ